MKKERCFSHGSHTEKQPQSCCGSYQNIRHCWRPLDPHRCQCLFHQRPWLPVLVLCTVLGFGEPGKRPPIPHVFRSAVPLPQRELPGKKLWGRYILRILAALFFWAALYKLYHLILGRNLSFGTLLSSCKELLAFQHESHLYYLHIVLLVYAFLPLLRLLTRYGSKRLVEYFLGLWFVLGILYPTVKGFWPFTLLSGVPTQWMMNMTYASLGYVLLGYYLRRWPVCRGLSLSLLAVGFAVVFGLTAGFSLRQGSLNTQFWKG